MNTYFECRFTRLADVSDLNLAEVDLTIIHPIINFGLLLFLCLIKTH